MACIDQVSLGETTYELVPEIASLFDTTKAYNVGDCVIKDAVLYRFTVAHAAGAWIGTDAEEITVGEELTDLELSLGKLLSTIPIDWSRGIYSANGAISTGNGASSSIISSTDDVALTSIILTEDCRAVVLFYSGETTYLGKLNATGGIDKVGGNWGYVTGEIDFKTLFEEFGADRLKLSVLPTDSTTITDDNVQSYGNAHCVVKGCRYATKADLIAQSNSQNTFLGVGYKTPDVISDGYGLTTDGRAVANSNFHSLKYSVKEGDSVWIKCNKAWGGKAAYQFQDAANVSSANTDHLIGTPVVDATDNFVTVPQDATWLIIAPPKTETESGVYNAQVIDDIKYATNSLAVIESRMGTENLIGNVPYVFYPIEARLDDVFTVSNGTGNTFASGTELHFYDENKQQTAYWGFGGRVSRTITYTPSTPAKYVAVHQSYLSRQQIMLNRGNDVLEYTPYLRNSVAASLSDQAVDIVDLNSGLLNKIYNATKLRSGYITVPLVLLHFSDVHGSATNLKRIIELRDSLGNVLDDTICTGDMVTNSFSDGFEWWNVDGAENILLCIGNHDVTDGVDYNNYGGTTPEGAYNTYFAPYIENWNVSHSGTLTYYYKDFTSKKIRLIALDYLLTGDEANAQNTWLQTVLSDAQSNDYTVAIIQHCPVSNEKLIESGFTMLDKTSSQTYPVMYQQSVKTFMDNGGKFACYLAGHTHWDMMCYNNDFPDQICICVSCTVTTGRDGDQYRGYNTKSQDAANVVVIDTTTKTVKLIRVGANMDYYLRPRNELTISYETKKIIAQN